MANSNEPSRLALGATLWPLITGLAIGYIVGQKTAGSGRGDSGGDERAAVADKPAAPAGTKMPDKIYKSQADFPADWTREADLVSVTAISFTGMSEAQKVT